MPERGLTASVLIDSIVQHLLEEIPMNRMIRNICIALLVAAGLVASSVQVRAEDRDDRDRHEKCERRIRQAEDKLHEAVDRHGENSKQAHKRREQLEQVRRNCGRDHDHDRDDHDRH